MRRACSNEGEAVRKYGANAEVLLVRLQVLAAAESLADVIHAPGKFHQLTEDRAGQFALALRGPHRLVFETADGELPRDDDGRIDFDRVRRIRIVEVVQYHG